MALELDSVDQLINTAELHIKYALGSAHLDNANLYLNISIATSLAAIATLLQEHFKKGE